MRFTGLFCMRSLKHYHHLFFSSYLRKVPRCHYPAAFPAYCRQNRFCAASVCSYEIVISVLLLPIRLRIGRLYRCNSFSFLIQVLLRCMREELLLIKRKFQNSKGVSYLVQAFFFAEQVTDVFMPIPGMRSDVQQGSQTLTREVCCKPDPAAVCRLNPWAVSNLRLYVADSYLEVI